MGTSSKSTKLMSPQITNHAPVNDRHSTKSTKSPQKVVENAAFQDSSAEDQQPSADVADMPEPEPVPVPVPMGRPLATLVSELRPMHEGSEQFAPDSHYEPLQPDTYIRYRLFTMLIFYKKRIPGANWTKNIAQLLLVSGSIASAAVSFFHAEAWASVISAASLAITAYMEFQGTNSKINRYSSSVHSLQEMVKWWQTLQTIDRSVTANIDRLVMGTEELLQREQQAWRSTSQVTKLLPKKEAKEEAEKDD